MRLLALAGLVILGVVGLLERRNRRLDRVLEQFMADLDAEMAEERETLVPSPADEPRSGMSIVDGNVVRRVTWDGPALNSYKSGEA